MDNIVQFPRRNKGRVRKTTSANAEGMWAIHQLRAAGNNIEIFNEHRLREIDRSEWMAYLLTTVLNSLPKEIKGAVKRRAWCDASMGKTDIDRISGTCLVAMFGGRHVN